MQTSSSSFGTPHVMSHIDTTYVSAKGENNCFLEKPFNGFFSSDPFSDFGILPLNHPHLAPIKFLSQSHLGVMYVMFVDVFLYSLK